METNSFVECFAYGRAPAIVRKADRLEYRCGYIQRSIRLESGGEKISIDPQEEPVIVQNVLQSDHSQ